LRAVDGLRRLRVEHPLYLLWAVVEWRMGKMSPVEGPQQLLQAVISRNLRGRDQWCIVLDADGDGEGSGEKRRRRVSLASIATFGTKTRTRKSTKQFMRLLLRGHLTSPRFRDGSLICP
jgi:hypothetical protein